LAFRDSGREWNLAQALRIAVAAERTLVALGVRLPPENRLARSRRLLAEFASRPLDPASVGFRELIVAQQNAIETFLIARTFQEVGRSDAAGLLRPLLRGKVDLREDASGAARNYQFELSLLALCDLGGMAGMFAEPDIVIRDPFGDVGIAAKRVASEGAVRERVKEAVSQIRRATPRGLVALNVDQLVSAQRGEQARASVEKCSVVACDVVEELGALGPIAGVLAIGAVIHRRDDGIPTLSYDFALRMASSGDQHEQALDAWSTALGRRIRAASNALFDEVLRGGP
jgi:hypothetical protein